MKHTFHFITFLLYAINSFAADPRDESYKVTLDLNQVYNGNSFFVGLPCNLEPMPLPLPTVNLRPHKRRAGDNIAPSAKRLNNTMYKSTDNQLINPIVEQEKRPSIEPKVHKNKQIKNVLDFVLELSENSDPKKILIELDLDGTLTDSANPPEIKSARYRKNSEKLIATLLESGVLFAFSSAWHDPKKSRQTFMDLGLHRKFPFDENENIPIEEMTLSLGTVNTYKLGMLAGAKSHNEKFYSHKALAPLLIYGPDIFERVKYIIFADDNMTNINVFKTEIASLVPQGVEVHCFHLVPPAEESDSEDGYSHSYDLFSIDENDESCSECLILDLD
jgi:hypothetical protein